MVVSAGSSSTATLLWTRFHRPEGLMAGQGGGPKTGYTEDGLGQTGLKTRQGGPAIPGQRPQDRGRPQ